MHEAYQKTAIEMDMVDVHALAAWMRVSVDRVHRWTKKGKRPLIPYYLEGGRKQFQPKRVENHIRRKCFCSTRHVQSPWPREQHSDRSAYPDGMKLLWTDEFLMWAKLSKAQIDRRVRLGEFPHFQFGGIRLWDPALILEARESRTLNPLHAGCVGHCHFPRVTRSKPKTQK